MIELKKVERINEGNLLSFEVDDGDITFDIIEPDDNRSKVKEALNIFSS